MKVAVDLDGTISEYSEFFCVLTAALSAAGCEIYIVTDRPPGTDEMIAQELESYNITYHVIKITGEKSDYILAEGIEVLFDDVDHYFEKLPESVTVFKIRQKYNYDFEGRRWRSEIE